MIIALYKSTFTIPYHTGVSKWRPPYDMMELSVDGWQPNGDAVVMQSQRLVSSVPSDAVEQCRPGIGALSC